MLSNSQKSLVKRAQRECQLSEAEYRDALEAAAGVRSSTDPRMTDRGVDLVLAYLEAIYWCRVDAGDLQPSGKPGAVFTVRGFWKGRNPRGNTTRDRYNGQLSPHSKILELESRLQDLGFDANYCSAIREKVTHSRQDDRSLHAYVAALKRTLSSKEKLFGDPSPG